MFLYAQFLIRLAAVSYHGKKVRNAASPVMRSVNKSRGTRNCVRTSQNMRSVSFSPLVCITNPYDQFCVICMANTVWQIRHNFNCLEEGYRDVSGHCKMSVLGTAGAMMTTHESSVMIWSFKGPKLFLRSAKPIGNEKQWWASHDGVVYHLNRISNFSRISDWSVDSGSDFFHSTGTFVVSVDSPLRR